jgi:hypothetical protein
MTDYQLQNLTDAPIQAISSTFTEEVVQTNQLETDHFERILGTDQPRSAIKVSNQSILGKRVRPPGDQLGENEHNFLPLSPKSKEI